MASLIELLDGRALFDAVRRALAACSDGLDVTAVQHDTPLAAVIFDSLMAVKFIATLESDLEVGELPFEQWLAEHSERSDALTFGSLVEWLQASLETGAGGAAALPSVPARRVSGRG